MSELFNLSGKSAVITGSSRGIGKSIAIIGHMGSGKTLIGKLIAKELNYRFFDSDKIIEKNTQKSI